MWQVVAKTSDRHQWRRINVSRRGPVAAGKWHNKSGAPGAQYGRARWRPRRPLQPRPHRRQPARAPVTANRSTAATCPPVAAAIVITWPGVARNVTLADHGLRVPPAARQQ